MKFALTVTLIAFATILNGAFAFDSKKPCGLTGTINKRINDCAKQVSSRKTGYELVTRTNSYKELYLEMATGLLWGDRLPMVANHFGTKGVCSSDRDEVGRLTGLKWRLPTYEEFKFSRENGILEALPNMKGHYFWSSTVHHNYSDVAWLFCGGSGNIPVVDRKKRFESVRCVSRID